VIRPAIPGGGSTANLHRVSLAVITRAE